MTDTQKYIPWAKPDYWGREIAYVTQALESTWISAGSFLNDLEAYFVQKFQIPYALAVSNGTTAIHLAYLGLDLKPNDEIIVPAFGFLAASNIALQMQIKPVFAEVNPQTWCLSAQDIAEKITPRTKAIVLVHTYGNLCEIPAIMELAKQQNIPVIEDTAEAIFSKYNGQYAGTFGDINTFSFQATKTITTGEGGLLTCHSEELVAQMKLYRSHGMTRGKTYYVHEVAGHNFRLTNFQAAMGMAQLEAIDTIIAERKRVYQSYQEKLKDISGISLQYFPQEVEPVYWALGIKLEAKAFPQGRDAVIKQMKAKNIETRPGFYTPSFLDIYEVEKMPIADELSQQIISLPFFPTLSEEDITRICEEFIKLKK